MSSRLLDVKMDERGEPLDFGGVGRALDSYQIAKERARGGTACCTHDPIPRRRLVEGGGGMREGSFFEVDLKWCSNLFRFSRRIHCVCNGIVMKKENAHPQRAFCTHSTY